MSDTTIVFAVIAATISLFVLNRLPIIIVAMASALALHLSGVLTLEQALAGFGDPVILFIASLFVITAALESTGVTAWAGQILSRLAAGRPARLSVISMLLVAGLAPIVSMNGAVATLLPVVMLMAVKLAVSPARLLMPLAFAAGAGSKLALSGTPKNVLISEASADAGFGGFGFFEFALVGIPLLIGTVLIVVLLGPRLLPNRTAATLPADLSRHAETLVEQFRLTSGLFRLRLRGDSPLVGALRSDLGLAEYGGLTLTTILERGGAPRMSGGHLAEGDLLVLRGEAQAAADFASRNALSFREADAADTLMNRQAGLAEVIIPPRSSFIGRDAFPGMVTSAGDLVVLAIQRGGEDMGPGSVTIAAGDHILLQGTWNALDSRLATPGVLLVESPELVRRQAVPLGAGAKSMLIVVGLMVAAIASGLATATVAGLMAAGAAILMNAISVERAYRAVNWTTIILIAAMFPISTAMYQTGGAAMIGEALVRLVGNSGPRVLLAALFVLAAGLGTVISNTATAMIVIPVAVIAAAQSGVSAQPVLMALNIGASAAFLTPVSTAVNLMVMGPAGYQFGDYWKLGLPLTLWYFVTAVFLVPLIWAF